MVKIHFLQKVLKKWSSFRKENKIFFSITGGGVKKEQLLDGILRKHLYINLKSHKWEEKNKIVHKKPAIIIIFF